MDSGAIAILLQGIDEDSEWRLDGSTRLRIRIKESWVFVVLHLIQVHPIRALLQKYVHLG